MVIASHVLEHIPDLVGFFASASRLVTPSGSLSIALPDRRYCFDCLKPWSTTGDLLDAHHRRLTRHSLKTAFNHMAYSALMDGELAWGPRPISLPVLMDPFQAAVETTAAFRNQADAPYEDYHAWQFTPVGFELAILELRALGLIDWHLETLEGPENFEFFAVLRRGEVAPDPASLQDERRDLLIRQLQEAREQIDFLLGCPVSVNEAVPSPAGAHAAVMGKLVEHDGKLREMAETLTLLRAVLTPVRTVWRSLRSQR
jgi:hypothetical protein